MNIPTKNVPSVRLFCYIYIELLNISTLFWSINKYFIYMEIDSDSFIFLEIIPLLNLDLSPILIKLLKQFVEVNLTPLKPLNKINAMKLCC